MEMKLALVHDWLKEIGGAERVLIELHRQYPDAPIYVLFYDKKFVHQWLPDATIHASFIQQIPFISKAHKVLTWLMPIAIESFDLSAYDRILSSSVIFSKGLVLKPTTKHVCYCYSPTRQIWDDNKKTEGWAAKLGQHVLRLWDRAAADRVDQFVAISKTVQARIKKYYHRDSIVIYPPVGNLQSTISKLKIDGFYLIVSRLYPSKNIDIAVHAFNKLGYPLVIIGSGPARRELERIAQKNIMFLGTLSDKEIAAYYQHCRAFIMPQEEDFGLTALEAMSCGKPVLALRRGGAMETVVESVTGEFFNDPMPEGLADAVRRMNERYDGYDPGLIRAHAEKFSLAKFKKEIHEILQ